MANPAKAGAFAMADHKRQQEDGEGPPLLRVNGLGPSLGQTAEE